MTIAVSARQRSFLDLALRAGFLHHRPGDGAVIVGEGLAHALHGDVRRVAHVRAQTNHNEGVLEKRRRFRKAAKIDERVPLTATPMTGDA